MAEVRSRQDIFKIAVSVLLVQLLLTLAIGGMELNINSSNSEVDAKLTSIFSDWGIVSQQIDSSEYVLEGITDEAVCEAQGGSWNNLKSRCTSGVIKGGDLDFSIFDIFTGIFQIVGYVWKFIKACALVVLFEIAISFKLSPLIDNFVILALFNVIIWAWQMYVLYYTYAFITNFRGQQQGLE